MKPAVQPYNQKKPPEVSQISQEISCAEFVKFFKTPILNDYFRLTFNKKKKIMAPFYG